MEIDKKLEEAVLLGNIALTQQLLSSNTNVNGKDKYGRTIIYYAIVKGFTAIVKQLCIANANINNQDNDGKTPLHFASIHNQLDIAKTLIEYGADINIKDNHGNNAISDAIFYSKGNPEIVLFLKKNGANYEESNNYGVSPKELANTIANFDFSYIFD